MSHTMAHPGSRSPTNKMTSLWHSDRGWTPSILHCIVSIPCAQGHLHAFTKYPLCSFIVKYFLIKLYDLISWFCIHSRPCTSCTPWPNNKSLTSLCSTIKYKKAQTSENSQFPCAQGHLATCFHNVPIMFRNFFDKTIWLVLLLYCNHSCNTLPLGVWHESTILP